MVTKSGETKSKKVEKAGSSDVTSTTRTGRSRAVAQAGIGDSHDVKRLMTSLIPDILDGAVDIASANAVCNATGKLLKMLELEMKYGGSGSSAKAAGPQPLQLC